ncbi:MAG: PorP/SprF family type IX secretion system membrane protein, partial [Bacteroidota bacterium]
MKILKGLLFFFFMTIMGSMNAQDIHFTQFYLSPLTTNPAYTGAFEGTFRIGGIYRDQWGGVISSPYRTPSFYVDAPILMVGKRSWLGVGGMMYADKAGQLDLSTNQFMGSAAIHLALDPKMKSIFTFGIQAGYTNRSVDIANATFGNEIQNGQIPGGDESVFSSNYFDMNVGALLKSQLNDQMRIEIGLAADNLLTADYHLNDSSIDADSTAGSASVDGRDAWENPSLFLLHGQFFIDLTDKIQAKPAFLFQSKSGANEIMIQAIGGYHLNE